MSSSVCTLRPLIASFTNYKNNSSPFRHNWIITAQAASPAKENRETEDDEEEEQELPPAGGAAMNYFMDQGGTDAQADAMTAAGREECWRMLHRELPGFIIGSPLRVVCRQAL